MVEDSTSTEIAPPKRLWELLERYIALSQRYDDRWQAIQDEAQNRLSRYLEKQSSGVSVRVFDTSDLLYYIDEFVDNLLIYYAYYRSSQRSMATLFASIGITDHRMFAEMVRVSSDPRVKIDITELDIQGIDWFLKQFIDEYQAVERNTKRLAQYLPRLENTVANIFSESMKRFLEVLRYATSQEAEGLREAGYQTLNVAIAEQDLSQKVNLVVEAIEFFVKDAQNHPSFILTESAGYFGAQELEEFDNKITAFKKIHELFKEHVSLSNRTYWVYERHHITLFSSIFEGSHLEIIDIHDKIRTGSRVREFKTRISDCQTMLLGVSQAYSLFLEYSAYSQQMLTLVDSYREIAEFLQSELLQILYTLQLQRNNLYLEVRDEFREILNEFQQTLLKVCSLDTTNN
jgi:hypothetical protein